MWKDFEEVMETYDNIMLLKEYQPYKIEFDKQEVVIYPAFCEKLHSNPGQNNIGWIKEAVHIFIIISGIKRARAV